MSEQPPLSCTLSSTHSFPPCRLVAALAIVLAALGTHVSRAQDYSDFFSYNGSFELGSSPPPLNFPSSHSTVNTVTGWEIYAGGRYPQWLEDSNAQDGSRYIRLRSTGGAGAGDSGATIDGDLISHTPFTLNEVYEMSFWAAGGPAQNNRIDIELALGFDRIQQSFNLPTYTQAEFDTLTGLEWSRYSMTFLATAPTMDLLLFSPDSTQGGYQSIVYLDNFSIQQAPEPGSALLAVVGAMLVAGRRRRRRPGGSTVSPQLIHV